MPRRYLTSNVFDEAIDRMIALYKEGHRIVVSFSAGKDSGICLEICLIAAQLTDRLPVEVVMRDEEIMLPGTFEYAERTVARPEIDFNWLIANQPIINIFNRNSPYFWVFDPLLDPSEWVRQPPEYAITIPDKNIEAICSPKTFPPPKGKELFVVIGLRTSESIQRAMGLFSSKGYTTGKDKLGTRKARPIYDWTDGDVWKAIYDNKWDYNSAYDVMNRLGIPKNQLRIAPPTIVAAGVKGLALAAKAWPRWFEKVTKRLPGTRTAAMFGRRAVEPNRKIGETWEACYKRTCIEEAPEWIAERAKKLMEKKLHEHSLHSTIPFPQNGKCDRCKNLFSWLQCCRVIYMGDPFSMKQQILPIIEPEFFREGAGLWGGKPTW